MPEDNYDAAPDKYTANNHSDVPQFTEDIENMMSGSNILPKALPQVTPDSQNHLNAGHHVQHHGHQQHPQHQNQFPARNAQNHHNQRSSAVKRRHSGKEAGKYRKRKFSQKKPNMLNHSFNTSICSLLV